MVQSLQSFTSDLLVLQTMPFGVFLPGGRLSVRRKGLRSLGEWRGNSAGLFLCL